MTNKEGIEKLSMKTVLGIDDEGVSTSDVYDVVVKDHGMKGGLQYDSVCISSADNTTFEEAPEKTVQVQYTPEVQDGQSFATVAVFEVPKEVTGAATVSKIVHLRSSKGSGHLCKAEVEWDDAAGDDKAFASDPGAMGASRTEEPVGKSGASRDEEGLFASDPEAMKFVKLAPKKQETSKTPKQEDDEEGIFASDPEAMKFVKLASKKQERSTTKKQDDDDEQEILASDPEAMKFIKLVPKKQESSKTQKEDDEEGIFASDPEAMKFIKLVPKKQDSSATQKQEDDDEQGIFASDPEVMKFVRLVPKWKPADTGSKEATGSSTAQGASFSSDPEVLNSTRFGQNQKRPAASATAVEPSTISKTAADRGEGDLLAEASGIELQDSRTYSVRVSGYDLPDGQLKKFVTVRNTDGQGGLTRREMDNMEVSVETTVGEDGMVEKFVVVE